ncbi:MAG: carboxypeptidase regulatory-like domain-containing protein [Chloroflexota bacterium]
MKKKFLSLLVLLIFALAACGGELDTVVESAQNIAEDVADSVSDELSGASADNTAEPTAAPAEEVVEEAVEEPAEEAAAGPSDRWAGSTLLADGPAVGATININGVEGQSDGSGNFELYVPRAEDGRYVINAELDGYLPVSQIHIGSAMEMLTLEFRPVETVTFDPTVGVEAEDSSGTQISVGPNQLVDADGNEPTGDVTLNMYTYDLTQEEMVGDMSGVNDQGEPVTMESAGAFYASFEDADGDALNVKEGETVEISVPVVEERPNEVLTVWSYDETTGLWVEEGLATLEDGRYVAEVAHFSYWNFDWEKRTPSCIKLEVEAGYLAANNPLNVRAVLQTNPTRVRDLSISQTTNVLINLPNNTDVQFFAAGESTPFATISSGAAWGGVGVPAFPYDACQGVAEVADAPEPATGAVQGQVVNATNDQPVAGAQVCITGTDQCTTTDDSGNYSFPNVPVGDLTLNVTAADFTPVDQSVTVTAGDPVTQNFALSPVLPTGELRIVLTWGANPADLDSHLYLPDNTDIYYNNKGGFLDVDDTTSFGPETITIPQRVDGTYSYAVYDYNQTNQLTASEAVVRVYDDTGLIETFPVPTTGTGTWWHVFDIDGATGAITPVNTLANSAPR